MKEADEKKEYKAIGFTTFECTEPVVGACCDCHEAARLCPPSYILKVSSVLSVWPSSVLTIFTALSLRRAHQD